MSNNIRKINVEYPGSIIFESVNRYLNTNAIEILNQNSITSSYTIQLSKPYLLFNLDINESDETTSILITIVESRNEPAIDNLIINDFLNNISKYFEIVQNEELNKDRFDDLIIDASRHIVKFQICNQSEIQKKFILGYSRTGRIIDQLELIGIIGTSKGLKNRDVLCNDFNKLNSILIENKIINHNELIHDDVIEIKKKSGLFSFFKK
jgi:DNA segregation ATPase FtsK/SpoIIIE-like protein